MWIREPFLDYAGSFEKLVVHGHTPNDTMWVQQLPNRIAIDTGAYESGRLSTLHIHPSARTEVGQAYSVAGMIAVSHGLPTPIERRRPQNFAYSYQLRE